ncbi:MULTISPECIES: macrolide family glycosyltransferase [unclassified Saccharopolyspora]|uniref:macrolide family glycosyltransferase n=1 Tax=unclassified Saccharopolyspora TaxID=2646250 RepID=UPI001CD314A5|nr:MULTISPECIES: macrolide family glycosyltransferase [unclassified Saccharopolyspora]MCA1189030.1 glycosyl transferase [Saccharopolyspora sp. 6T]MCA1195285.1 glycosyl transferase [Saccharopolyspora sp. 6V]MCA1229663.1 glycosyl transferase [Saccharopolyspora sp. 6M]MCA1283508.1 glycosyl transferase [Saccharopolyspora sp. 7B]
MNKHIAVVTVPGHGHINPTLPLVEELTRRGNRVSYATGQSMLELVEAAGADGVEMPSTLPSVRPGMQMTVDLMAGMLEYLHGESRNALPVLLERFSADRPDVVCVDMLTPAGRLLAQKLDVPIVPLVPSFAANEQVSLQQRSVPADFDPQHPALVKAAALFQELGEEYGLSGDQFPMRPVPGADSVVFLPKSFQFGGETFDDGFHFVGPCLGSRAEQDYTPADEQAPLLFISLGTGFNDRPDLYRTFLEAFGGTRWQVAMSIGGVVDVAELGEIPANFDVRPSFPQLGVLRRASAFVTHNGMGSTMEALAYGVPMVGVPQMMEQAANADRVTELGLGRRLPEEEITAQSVFAAVEAVASDEDIRANLAGMRADIAAAGGPVAGADVIENACR